MVALAMERFNGTPGRAVAQGVKLGRPKIDSTTERKVRRRLAKGMGILKVAKSLGIGTGTVQRISKGRAMSLRGAVFLLHSAAASAVALVYAAWLQGCADHQRLPRA